MIKKQRFTLSPLELIAFVDGFSLMVYELVAARILAPYIGSSLYIWTSVIGVIIMALSLGYWAGGVVADKRNKSQDVAWLLLAVAGGIASTILFSSLLIPIIVEGFSDPRLQGVVASFTLFAPTSFLIGMISPYLVKLQLRTLTQTGQTVAAISAFNAVGGILGTFLTGFFFFQIFGSRASLLLIVALLIITSWLIHPKIHIIRRLSISTCIIACALLPPLSQSIFVASIDTTSAHYTIKDVIYNDSTVRVLQTGPGGYQSGKDFSKPSELVFWYTQTMASIASDHSDPRKILIIGAGAFSLPQHLAAQFPSSIIDVVDVDAELLPIATQYFGYRKTANVRFFSEDGRTFLNKTTDKYDVILVDAFSNTTIPFTLTTTEFSKNVHRALADRGTFAMNIIASQGNNPCGALLKGLETSLVPIGQSHKLIFSQPAQKYQRQNIILTFSRVHYPHTSVKDSKEESTFTDDYAPVESLSFECLRAV